MADRDAVIETLTRRVADLETVLAEAAHVPAGHVAALVRRTLRSGDDRLVTTILERVEHVPETLFPALVP